MTTDDVRTRYKAVTNRQGETDSVQRAALALAGLHAVLRSWRKVGSVIGYSGGYAKLVADGKRQPSQKALDALHEYMTGEPAPPLVSVAPCPSCAARGVVISHGDKLDCHGNGGAVVVLAPGETVRKPRGPWQSKARPEVAAMVRGLQLCLERKVGA